VPSSAGPRGGFRRWTSAEWTGADEAARMIDDATEGLTERHAESLRVVGQVWLVGVARASVGSRPAVAGFGRAACRALARPAG
jgi:hypothetical protein